MTFCLGNAAQQGCGSVAGVKQNAVHQTFMTRFARGCILKDWAPKKQQGKKAVLLRTAAVSCIFFHLFFKAERRAPLWDLLWFCTSFWKQMVQNLGKEGMIMLKTGSPASAGTSFQLYGDPEEGSGHHICLKGCVWLHYYCG